MNEIIVTTESRLIELIENTVGKYYKKETLKTEPVSVNIVGTKSAVDYLRANGYEISESLLTKQTAKGLIPCRRFHNKRLLFSGKKLLEWAESKCEPIGCNSSALTLAANANRKLKKTR